MRAHVAQYTWDATARKIHAEIEAVQREEALNAATSNGCLARCAGEWLRRYAVAPAIASPPTLQCLRWLLNRSG